MKSPESIEEVLNVYRTEGHRSYGEDVTELQHALQCATFAQMAGEPPMIIAAALLHDFGHLCHQLGEDIAGQGVDARHEEIGYFKLKDLFPAEIADACRLHVPAKRYLCWKEPQYEADLSGASRQSLLLQGGPMQQAEALAFEAEPHALLAVTVRRYDDMGKVPAMVTPDLESFVPLLQSIAGPQPGTPS
jgi:phosphonate degradation associated HDIG domain protein